MFPSTIDPSARVSVASTATLLLLLLMRLNRVVVPWLMRLFRHRRHKWMSSVPGDVAHEMRKKPKDRLLCAGACCRESYYQTYGAIDPETGSPQDGHHVSDVSDGGHHVKASVHLWLKAVVDDRDADGVADDEEDGEPSRPSESEIYYLLRVAQEERHRARTKFRFMYPQEMSRYYTLMALVAYSAMIIYCVLHMFVFALNEALFFSVSLVWSGVISEWDALLPIAEFPLRWMKRAGDAGIGKLPV